MQKQLNTWKFLLASLEQKVPAVLLYVLESKGSSPGRQGFFMGVNADGKMEGSVGGGIMEHKFVEMAKEQMKQHRLYDANLFRQVHDKTAGEKQSGMICSGEQTIFLYPVKFTDTATITSIIESLEQFRNGTLELSPAGLRFMPVIPSQDFTFINNPGEDWIYKEKTGFKNKLFIVGGGHCSLAFSKLMSEMDFYITVFEEREGLNTLEQNNYAHEAIVVDDYTALNRLIPSGPNQYMVVMSFGYRSDDIAVRALLGKRFNYFGILGSKNKIEKMFAEYSAEGLANELKNIHAPVGIPIASQTPEEIAVSIAAEIIRVKNSV
jgi:xanthine dehydrogenase accessory factor